MNRLLNALLIVAAVLAVTGWSAVLVWSFLTGHTIVLGMCVLTLFGTAWLFADDSN